MKHLLRPGLLLFLFLFSFILFASCKKKEIQGPQGDPGTPGGGGNSNIVSTTTFPVLSTQWVADSAAASWKATIASSLITQTVVEKGAVKVTVQVDADWWELPYISEDLVTQFGFKEGVLYITVSDIHEVLQKKPASQNFRMVILTES